MTVSLTNGEICDRYVIEGFLGEGAMGIVYRARHTSLGTLHAIKLLRMHTEYLVRRMLEEARNQGRLRHPNIVGVSDFLDIKGVPAIVQEFVEGPSLEQLVDTGPLPIHRIDELTEGILAAVQTAHEAGLVHRDIKPANVLIRQTSDRWIPMLTDFGLVKALHPDEHKPITISGTTMGTPGYMAPEQFSDAASVDARADLFSVGVVAYEMATGKRPFPGMGLTQPNQKQATEYKKPETLRPDLPPRMAKAIRHALQGTLSDRVSTASLFLSTWRGKRVRPTDEPLTWTISKPEDPSRWNYGEHTGVTASSQETSSEGDNVFGRFQLQDLLGEGGGGQVYRAIMQGPVGFRKSVALKVLRPDSWDTQAREDLLNEARFGGLLKHPNIVETYDLGQSEKGFYVAMEWVQGPTLRQRYRESGPLPSADVIQLGVQVCRGLEHAHTLQIDGQRTGIIHRDLKPSNLLLAQDGQVKIADFGIATLRQVEDDSGKSRLIRGTPGYMAPEQLSGEENLIGPHTDLFALGVILTEMLTGASPQPVHGGLIGLRSRLANHLGQAQLVRLLQKALQLHPEDRFQSAQEMAAALEALAVVQEVKAPSPLGATQPINTPRSNPTIQPVGELPTNPMSLLLSSVTSVVISIPVLMGILALIFGPLSEILSVYHMGPFLYPIALLTIIQFAMIPVLWRKLKAKEPISVILWLLPPTGIRICGSLSTLAGLNQAEQAISNIQVAMKPALTSAAMQVVLTTEVLSIVLAGIIGAVTLGVGALAAGNLHTPNLRKMVLWAAGLSLAAWTVSMFFRTQVPMVIFPASPYLCAIGLVFCIGALATMAESFKTAKMNQALMLMVFSSLWVSDTTTLGTMLLEQRALFANTIDSSANDWLMVMDALQYVSGQEYWIDSLAWFTAWSFGLFLVLNPMQSGIPWERPGKEEYIATGLFTVTVLSLFIAQVLSAIVAIVLLLALVLYVMGVINLIHPKPPARTLYGVSILVFVGIGMWVASDRARMYIGTAAQPALLTASSQTIFGATLGDSGPDRPWAQGVEVLTAYKQLRPGDFIVTLDGRPVLGLQDLLEQVTGCACDKPARLQEAACWRETCLAKDSTVDLGLLRASSDEKPGDRPILQAVELKLWPEKSASETAKAMGPRLTLNLTDPNATKLQHAQFTDVIALFLHGELNATHRKLLPLMEQLPNDPAPILLQATIDAIQEKPVRFHKRIVKLMEMTPTDTEFGQTVHMLGRACLGKGINQREQWETFNQRPRDPFFHILGAVFSVLMWEGDYDALTTQIEQSLQQYPDEVLLSLIALEVFNVQGNVGKMEQLLSEGVQRFPSSTLLHLYRIKQLIHLEEYEMAKKESERLLSIDPGETQLHQLRAVALLHLGEEEAFQTQLATILGESLPEEGKAEVLHQLGLQVWNVGRVQEALDLTEICAARAAVANNYTQSTFCLWRAAFMSYWSGDIPTARKFIEQGRVHLKRPEIDGHHARASNANILYLEGLIAGTQGKQEVVKQIRARLEALPANLFGSFPMFKQHIIKRLEYNNLVHNGQPQTLEATLENFHPKESTNLGQVLLRGPEGCFADWMRVHLVKARPESTTLRTQTTEKLLSRNRCETTRDALLRNASLIEQAKAEWTAKNLSSAKALLLQEEKEWPMADATLPPQRMASTLRRALGMSPKTRTILPKTLASPTNLPPGRSPCDETQDAHANSCQNGERAWCDEHNTQVACCAPGLYPTPEGNGICACPAGGSTEPEAVKNGCEQANPEKYKQSIQDYFAAPVEQITSCYQRALGNTVRLRGKVTVRFALGPEGQVLRSRIGSSSLPHPPTQQCVRREIQRHHWPSPPDGFVEISYPLEFEQTTDPTKSPEEP